MAIRIRKLTLWRTEVPHRPGALATLLDPLAAAGADLQVVMGYRLPGDKSRAVVEVAPINSRRPALAAERAGLVPGGAPTLQVLGDNRPGLANRIARALADSHVNVVFLVAQVVGKRYSAVFGFEGEADLDKAADRIRAAVVARPIARPAAARKPARRPRALARAPRR
jgi:hypothetical protein